MSNHRFFLYFLIMYLFNQLYVSVYQKVKKLKPRLAAKAAFLFFPSSNRVASFSGRFFMKFSKQMKMNFLTTPNSWLLFVGITMVVLFKNWVGYSGKKRSILFSKASKPGAKHSLLWLVVFQLLVYALTFIVSKAA